MSMSLPANFFARYANKSVKKASRLVRIIVGEENPLK